MAPQWCSVPLREGWTAESHGKQRPIKPVLLRSDTMETLQKAARTRFVPGRPNSWRWSKLLPYLAAALFASAGCTWHPDRTGVVTTLVLGSELPAVNAVDQTTGTLGDARHHNDRTQMDPLESNGSQAAGDSPQQTVSTAKSTLMSLGSRQARSKQNKHQQTSSKNLSSYQKRSMQEEKAALPLRSYAYGNIHQTAYYFADVVVGTPAVQRQSLILDTGSSVLAFPCTSCKSCGRHMDPPFDCSSSSTCKSVPCSSTCTHCDAKQKRCAYRVSYMEGSSLQGFWHEDQFRLLAPPRTVTRNNQSFYDIKSQLLQAQRKVHSSDDSGPSSLLTQPVRTNFGCHVQETELFVDQKASGIWGLEIWSQFGPETYMTRTLLSSTKGSRAVTPASLPDGATSFALCLAEHGGAFSIGDANGELHTSDTVTTNFIPHQESYSAYLSGISVGDKIISLGNSSDERTDPSNVPQTLRGSALQSSSPARNERPNPPHHTPHPSTKFEVLLDSGTTMSYFPTRIYDEIVSAIEEFAELKGGRRTGNDRRRLAGAGEKLTAAIKEARGNNSPTRGKLIRLLGREEHDSGSEFAPNSIVTAQQRATARNLAATTPLGVEQETLSTGTEDFSEIASAWSAEQDDELIINFVDRLTTDKSNVETSGTINAEGIRRAAPGEISISNPQRRRQERPTPSLAKIPATSEATQHIDNSTSASAAGGQDSKTPRHNKHLAPGRDRRQQRRQARRVELGEEVRDSEAEAIGDIITTLSVDDEVAYELLPPSASPRQSQAVKVESTAGELCFYLPKGRADLSYFPDIWLHFVPPHQNGGAASPLRRDDTTVQDARDNEVSVNKKAGSGWVRWQPASYLYTKGNEHYRCVAMSDDPRADSSGVLGSSFFIGHDLIFDVRHEMIGIAEASCPGIKLKDRPKDLPM
uniref:Eukaryotic aspartyl protease superfamily protein n=1 Tax=Toxoplasma gondii COUG TaxID=1074873 RepID=A0A2G8YEF0_TOXGO|nr:eukaryotic aspartyl protease superfamily protein [Toxoplasma gondii COUG]